MKKLFDSHWLRAVQFKGNYNAKSVTPVHTFVTLIENVLSCGSLEQALSGGGRGRRKLLLPSPTPHPPERACSQAIHMVETNRFDCVIL